MGTWAESFFSHESGLNLSTVKKQICSRKWVFLEKLSSVFTRGSWCSVSLGWAMGTSSVCP